MTGIWQIEFDTEDPATHYQNGILSDLEALAIKRFKNGFGIGFVESWIQQVNDDEGAPAALNGFSGRAFGIGPIVTYATKLGKSHLDFSAHWIHDFGVSKRVEGDAFNFSASLKFWWPKTNNKLNAIESKLSGKYLDDDPIISLGSSS